MLIDTTNPRILLNNTLYELKYTKVDVDLFTSDYIVKKSINGKKKYIKKNSGILFNLLVFLYKYEQKEEMFELFNNLKGKVFELLLKNNSKIPVYAYEIKNLYLNNKIFYDLINIKLINLDDLKISNYIITKDGQILKTKLGELLRTRGIII